METLFFTHKYKCRNPKYGVPSYISRLSRKLIKKYEAELNFEMVAAKIDITQLEIWKQGQNHWTDKPYVCVKFI